jgi:hypothetical protein
MLKKTVQDSNAGITNNEVSKVIGDMWKQESQKVKDHYQALAQQSREQHQKDYPGYKYAPRRPGERKRRGVHHQIVYADSETASNTGDSILDARSPADYSMSPAPNGDYFRYTSSGSYYQDMLAGPPRMDSSSPDEYSLSQFTPTQQPSCLPADVEQAWAPTPILGQTPDVGPDAGNRDLDYENANPYEMFQGISFY